MLVVIAGMNDVSSSSRIEFPSLPLIQDLVSQVASFSSAISNLYLAPSPLLKS
jgi:hypothetical protein